MPLSLIAVWRTLEYLRSETHITFEDSCGCSPQTCDLAASLHLLAMLRFPGSGWRERVAKRHSSRSLGYLK